MVGKSLALILISVVCVRSYNLTSLKIYDTKTCKNEPSCDLVDDPTLPSDRRTLRKRPCMCDADCVTYRDCCTDSKYYNELEQCRPPPFYCQPTYKVYMKTTCPETWTNEEVKSKCILSTYPLRSDDTNLILPVTNIKKNITYGNKYCALCNGDTQYRVWILNPLCGEAPPGFLLRETTILPSVSTTIDSLSILPRFGIIPTSNPSTVIPRSTPSSLPMSTIDPTSTPSSLPISTADPTSTQSVVPMSTTMATSMPVLLPKFTASPTSMQPIHSPIIAYFVLTPTSRIIFRQSQYVRRKRHTKITVDFYKYIRFVSDIWKNARYDPQSTYFVSRYSNKDIICRVSSKLPTNLKPHTRACVPSIIETCKEAEDPDMDKKCRNHTSIVFNRRNNKAYRNKYCATCDGAETEYLTGCPIIVREETTPATWAINS